ncbi:MAG: hypothetical protein IPN71_10625 [Fibrobacteres bacterium]|nr:hypothetical protein [Fibrobacterota bacterium]
MRIGELKSDSDTLTIWFLLDLIDGNTVLDSVKISPNRFEPFVFASVGFTGLSGLITEGSPGDSVTLALSYSTPQFPRVISVKAQLGSFDAKGVNPFWGIAPSIEISAKNSSFRSPLKPGAYAYRYQVDYSDGTCVTGFTNNFYVLDPAPKFESIEIRGDSLTVRWNDSLSSSQPTIIFLGLDYTRIGNPKDSVIVPAKTTTVSIRMSPGWESIQISLKHALSSRRDTIVNIPNFAWTFSGAMGDTSRLRAGAGNIGGFRAWVSASIGEVLFGEVARLNWYREDSTSEDGARLNLRFPARFWYDDPIDFNPSLVVDTLSFDLASPASMSLEVSSLVYYDCCNEGQPPDTLRWSIPPGTIGHLDLPITSGGWPTPIIKQTEGWGIFDSWSDGFTITATQTTGPRARQGFLEVDNVRWH